MIADPRLADRVVEETLRVAPQWLPRCVSRTSP